MEVGEVGWQGLDLCQGISGGQFSWWGIDLLKEVVLGPGEVGFGGAGFGADEGEEVGG